MPSQLKILFIDDHAGLRESLSYLLEHKNDVFKFYLAGDSERALMYLKSNPDISIAVVDLNLTDEDGLDVVDKIRTLKPELKIIIYTMYNDPMHIKQSLQKNIQGFITKDLDVSEVEKAILSVNEGNLFYCKAAQNIMFEMMNKSSSESGGFYEDTASIDKQSSDILFKNYQTLTKKEQELFEILAQKKDVEEAAVILNKSTKTIQNQKSIIYQKMNLRDRLELVDAAKLLGVII